MDLSSRSVILRHVSTVPNLIKNLGNPLSKPAPSIAFITVPTFCLISKIFKPMVPKSKKTRPLAKPTSSGWWVMPVRSRNQWFSHHLPKFPKKTNFSGNVIWWGSIFRHTHSTNTILISKNKPILLLWLLRKMTANKWLLAVLLPIFAPFSRNLIPRWLLWKSKVRPLSLNSSSSRKPTKNIVTASQLIT